MVFPSLSQPNVSLIHSFQSSDSIWRFLETHTNTQASPQLVRKLSVKGVCGSRQYCFLVIKSLLLPLEATPPPVSVSNKWKVSHTYCTHMGRVPCASFSHIKEWTHITGSQQTFYRPIDIALLWHREVIVRKEFLTVFMDRLNFTWEGLKARLKCYLYRPCVEWVHPLDWSHFDFLLYPAVLCILTNDNCL